MDAECVHPHLVLPMEMPQSDKGWSRVKLTDDRATLVLEKMNADLKPGNAKAAKVTGAILLREFLMLRVAPLQARMRPLWRLGDEEDKVPLSPEALLDEELVAALRLLVGDDQEYPPSVFVPLFRRKDGEQRPPAVSAATVPVEVSSDDSREEDEDEDEERDSEATPEGMGGTSPLSKADILYTLPDDDEADAPQEKGGPPAGRLSGFRLSKRRVDYTAVDQPTPAAKKRKEEAVVLLGTNPPAPAASPSVEKGSVGAHISPARSSSRGLGENPLEEPAPVAPLAPEAPVSGSAAEISKAQETPVSQAMVTVPSHPPPAAPLIPGPSASPVVLERALLEITRLREDLQGADPLLVAGGLELVFGWLHSDVSEKQAAAQAAAACVAALKDVEAAQDHCRALEAELKTLRSECAEEARSRKAEEEKMKARENAIKGRDAGLEQSAKVQATERGQLEELEWKVGAEKAELDAKAKVLAEDRAAFALLEESPIICTSRAPAGSPSPHLSRSLGAGSSAACRPAAWNPHFSGPTLCPSRTRPRRRPRRPPAPAAPTAVLLLLAPASRAPEAPAGLAAPGSPPACISAHGPAACVAAVSASHVCGSRAPTSRVATPCRRPPPHPAALARPLLPCLRRVPKPPASASSVHPARVGRKPPTPATASPPPAGSCIPSAWPRRPVPRRAPPLAGFARPPAGTSAPPSPISRNAGLPRRRRLRPLTPRTRIPPPPCAGPTACRPRRLPSLTACRPRRLPSLTACRPRRLPSLTACRFPPPPTRTTGSAACRLCRNPAAGFATTRPPTVAVPLLPTGEKERADCPTRQAKTKKRGEGGG
nr:actin cytoskeleton-regulatory complex protein PAN1-like [Aegilops tauschii subsp. strangulata]